MNNTAVTEEVNRIKNSPALLLWYTGDEPDGTSDPLNATTTAYDLIYSLDGYHPVSLVLNCQDFYWTEYTAGSDIVMQDAYTIGINATFSTVWVRLPHYSFRSHDCYSRLTMRTGHAVHARLWGLRLRQLQWRVRGHQPAHRPVRRAPLRPGLGAYQGRLDGSPRLRWRIVSRHVFVSSIPC